MEIFLCSDSFTKIVYAINIKNRPRKISFLPWLITTSCLISQFQISGRKSETLGRGFKLSAEDLDIRPMFLESDIRPRVSSNLVLKLTREKKQILSIDISRFLHHVWYLNFRCPAAHLKLSTEDLDIRPRVWVWIWRLVYISSAKVFGFRYPAEDFIKSGP